MTTPTSPSRAKAGASWDASRQQSYRQQHPDQALQFHFILDESPSMMGDAAKALMKAFNQYLGWLQHHADPMSQAEIRVFSATLSPGKLETLGTVQPLTPQTYNPRNGDGTALFRAVGETCTQANQSGQHVLVVFTDGYDNASSDYGWDVGRLCAFMRTLQQQQNWLCVFLGAVPDSLLIGASMGFAEGNCLQLGTDKIPEAFQKLTQATLKYLKAAPAERKLLTTGGVF